MSVSKIRLATRESPLAMWQAEHVKSLLLKKYPAIEIELLPMKTAGDRHMSSLSASGGKASFVKELEYALIENRADIAVHSMKDMPVELPSNLVLGAILPRGDARDVLVSPALKNADWKNILPQARVGTSSLRRRAQLQAICPEWQFHDMRGNINTRLRKLEEGQVDILVLAAAGVQRLGFEHFISAYVSPEECLPASSQAALGVECRENDIALREILVSLQDAPSTDAVLAERAVVRALGGHCHVPLAVYAEIQASQLWLRACVGTIDGRVLVKEEIRGVASEGESLGVQLADQMLARGAGKILDMYAHHE